MDRPDLLTVCYLIQGVSKISGAPPHVQLGLAICWHCYRPRSFLNASFIRREYRCTRNSPMDKVGFQARHTAAVWASYLLSYTKMVCFIFHYPSDNPRPLQTQIETRITRALALVHFPPWHTCSESQHSDECT